jgi:hypothetical protein
MGIEEGRTPPRGMSRRKFLGRLGAGAASTAVLGSVGNAVATAATTRDGAAMSGAAAGRTDRFTRMFRQPPFALPSAAMETALREIGKPGGMLDAKDDLSKGPVALIVDPALNVGNPNNPTHTAGTTFMGQFLDHDITFDLSSRLGQVTSPEATLNVRTPAFDLDTVYGGGPGASAVLYQPGDPIKLRVESGGRYEDLPRTTDNVAIIADPRNDENLVIAGLQVAFLKFHNAAVDRVRSEGVTDPSEAFAAARRLTTWHYHWMILHEFLPLFIGQQAVNDILARGRRHYTATVPIIPVEFQGAAYRFGHSMVRPSYRVNVTGNGGAPFFGFVFDPSEAGSADPSDLSGGFRAERRFIDWETFFDFGDGQVRPNKKIDTAISTPLFNLPVGTIAKFPGTELGPTSLPQRNLLRHLTWLLPSGQRLAQVMGLPVLSPADLDELSGFGLNLDRSTPLWLYILREAELVADGLHLGPVGGRIVGEVFIGLLQTDPASYLRSAPQWRPTLPTRSGDGDFRMVDFLTLAGVDPQSRAS